ncbi:protein GOLVEN 9 [Raphanus sativus]|uniref:Protein GOLVEN 9 n=1 Tax=Raphanus sativus TaxID=3726 RepID=A0A9W3DRW7_RAPSA|nr:protein GOLVEN 9 [Raphanus sativus]
MKNTNAKLTTLVVGFLVLMMTLMNLPHALQGGNIDVVGSKYEDNYGLMVSGSDEPPLMGRKLKSSKAIDQSATKKRTDSAKEIDNLMRGDYSSRMKGKKRSPIHN